ncbi:MAG: LysR family transcriptional regulator [Lachnospiraceae bacterium]|nr:LysR family transcriptional regulator [Lachnospiraceae bacterium]
MLSENLMTFVTVCENGGLTKASDKLFVTESTVCQRIKNLENEMGIKLIIFRRGQKAKMKLTKQGEILLKYCKNVIISEEKLKEELFHCKS